jgi:thymidylate synthase
LEAQGVGIWKGNSSREYLDSIGLDYYPEGECGPIYGHQWRNFNSEGFDQLGDIIHQIKTDPTSRRIFMSAWNPAQMKQMCLPPCHVSYQFYVGSDNSLSCQLYMRSADMFLGLPFNIASTGLLTYIVGALTGTTPSRLLVCIGDAHIYSSHLDQIKTQLKREPLPSPKVLIHLKPNTTIDSIDVDSIELQDYQSHGKISAPMIA